MCGNKFGSIKVDDICFGTTLSNEHAIPRSSLGASFIAFRKNKNKQRTNARVQLIRFYDFIGIARCGFSGLSHEIRSILTFRWWNLDGGTYLSLSSTDCPSSAEVAVFVDAPSTAFMPASFSGVVEYLTADVALVTTVVFALLTAVAAAAPGPLLAADALPLPFGLFEVFVLEPTLGAVPATVDGDITLADELSTIACDA